MLHENWKLLETGNHFLYNNKLTGLVFCQNGDFKIVITRAKAKKGTGVFGRTSYDNLESAKEAVELLLYDPDFNLEVFRKMQAWHMSKSGNPYRKILKM